MPGWLLALKLSLTRDAVGRGFGWWRGGTWTGRKQADAPASRLLKLSGALRGFCGGRGTWWPLIAQLNIHRGAPLSRSVIRNKPVTLLLFYWFCMKGFYSEVLSCQTKASSLPATLISRGKCKEEERRCRCLCTGFRPFPRLTWVSVRCGFQLLSLLAILMQVGDWEGGVVSDKQKVAIS